MDILTDKQWADWRLDPVTQSFMKYILYKKQEISRQKMEMLSMPAENINPYTLSLLNGMESVCNGILKMNLSEMVSELHGLEEDVKEYRKMLKESMGVEL
jgi:hypothetical protein